MGHVRELNHLLPALQAQLPSAIRFHDASHERQLLLRASVFKSLGFFTRQATQASKAGTPQAHRRDVQHKMNIVILDDYQDAVRKLHCAARLDPYAAKVYTNNVKGLGQLSVRLRDADIIVLIRDRTQITRQLVEKLPRLKMIAQTGRVGSHIDVAACTERGIAVAEGVSSPVAPAELTWALIMAAMRRLPQYIANLKHGAWQQSGLRAASMPANFGLGSVLRGKTLGIWGYGRIGQIVAGYGRAFGMNARVWGREASRAQALKRARLGARSFSRTGLERWTAGGQHPG